MKLLVAEAEKRAQLESSLRLEAEDLKRLAEQVENYEMRCDGILVMSRWQAKMIAERNAEAAQVATAKVRNQRSSV